MAIQRGRTEQCCNDKATGLFHQFALSTSMFILVLFFMASAAVAETVNSSEWGFSAVFPGQMTVSAQPVQTDAGKVTIVTYTSENEQQAFMIAVNDYPKGTVVSLERSYNGAIEGFANGVKGKIRIREPYKLGNVNGFDFFVDGPASETTAKPMVFHVRTFIIGDRMFQVAYVGPAGTEQNIEVLKFLNSFRLL